MNVVHNNFDNSNSEKSSFLTILTTAFNCSTIQNAEASQHKRGLESLVCVRRGIQGCGDGRKGQKAVAQCLPIPLLEFCLYYMKPCEQSTHEELSCYMQKVINRKNRLNINSSRIQVVEISSPMLRRINTVYFSYIHASIDFRFCFNLKNTNL